MNCLGRSDDVPCLHIPRCPHVVKTASPFYVSNVADLKQANATTVVTACYNQTGLHIVYDATDHHVVTPWTTCNSPVFRNSSTLEFFAAPVRSPTDNPQWYNEIDTGPSGAMWAGVSHNMKGNVSNCDHCVAGMRHPCFGRDVFPPYSADGLGVRVRNTSTGWAASLFVPFAMFPSEFVGHRHPWPLWRVNFYRYAFPAGPSPRFDNYELSGWSPTHDPSFHIPSRFGVAVLVGAEGVPLSLPNESPTSELGE